MESGNGESPVSLDERDPFVVTGEAEAWAEKYLAADGSSLDANSDLIRDVESDKINHRRLETEVQRLLSIMDVEEGFCAKCRHLLCHWPDLSTTEWAFSRDFGSVSKIEAAARAGCKFCAFFFSRLGCTKKLDTFRKIEQRLAVLCHNVSTVLLVQPHGPWPLRPTDSDRIFPTDSHRIFLNLPGRKAYLPDYAGGFIIDSISSVEDPSGKTFLPYVLKVLPGIGTDWSNKRACGKEKLVHLRLPEYG